MLRYPQTVSVKKCKIWRKIKYDAKEKVRQAKYDAKIFINIRTHIFSMKTKQTKTFRPGEPKRNF